MAYDDWKLATPPEYDECPEDESEPECMGHDSVTCGDYDGYPRTVYCDGSCRGKAPPGWAKKVARLTQIWECAWQEMADGINGRFANEKFTRANAMLGRLMAQRLKPADAD
jgi:hypothetical protein